MPSVGIVVTITYLYDINDERIALGASGATTIYPFTFYNVGTSRGKATITNFRGRPISRRCA